MAMTTITGETLTVRDILPFAESVGPIQEFYAGRRHDIVFKYLSKHEATKLSVLVRTSQLHWESVSVSMCKLPRIPVLGINIWNRFTCVRLIGPELDRTAALELAKSISEVQWTMQDSDSFCFIFRTEAEGKECQAAFVKSGLHFLQIEIESHTAHWNTKTTQQEDTTSWTAQCLQYPFQCPKGTATLFYTHKHIDFVFCVTADKIMRQMGYSGGPLGKKRRGLEEPLPLNLKIMKCTGRPGLGYHQGTVITID